MTVYEVVGKLPYREHKPGELFEASLDKEAEKRALARRNIRVVDETPTALQPGSWRLPRGWKSNPKEEE